jgi:uncharacterized protein
MEIRGPVRGSPLVKTKYSPMGTMTRGTINNCAHGYTPWGTYLTCEENWAGYFKNNVQISRISALFDAWATRARRPSRELLRAHRLPGKGIIGASTRPSTRNSPATSTRRQATPNQTGRFCSASLTSSSRTTTSTSRCPGSRAATAWAPHSSRYGWETAIGGADEYVRFDAAIKAADATDDYRNEPNGQGLGRGDRSLRSDEHPEEAHRLGSLRA